MMEENLVEAQMKTTGKELTGAQVEGLEKKLELLQKIKTQIDELSLEKLAFLKDFVDYFFSQPLLNQDNKNLLGILPKLLTLQNSKESQYGRSWCKHKDFSAFFNVERKWDRIFNIMSRVIKEGSQILEDERKIGTPTETFVDTIVDLGLYSLMWAGLIRELRPEHYEKFLKNNNLNF